MQLPEDILDYATRRFGLRQVDCARVRSSESAVYTLVDGPRRGFLRISHSAHRSSEAVHAELDFLDHLHTFGMRVPRPMPALSGAYVVRMERSYQDYFTAVLFTPVLGQKLRLRALTPDLLVRYGQTIGRLHAVSRSFRPSITKRPFWLDECQKELAPRLERHAPGLRDTYRRLLEELQQLPTGGDVFGLIHRDAQPDNIFMDERGQLALIDFDDSAYDWLANDVAIALFQTLPLNERAEAHQLAAFLRPFLAGYCRELPFSRASFESIPTFLRLRELQYFALARDAGGSQVHPSQAAFLHDREQRILRGVPPADEAWFRAGSASFEAAVAQLDTARSNHDR